MMEEKFEKLIWDFISSLVNGEIMILEIPTSTLILELK
jgi:hypothetical protein